jgi:hypothetical protein
MRWHIWHDHLRTVEVRAAKVRVEREAAAKNARNLAAGSPSTQKRLVERPRRATRAPSET